MKCIFLTAFVCTPVGCAQDVVSARAGMIQHIEGDVQIDGKTFVMPSREKLFSRLPEVKKGSTMTTSEGRAEVLLSPGVTLRLGEDATFKMIDSDLAGTKLEIVKGIAIVEVLEVLKENLVTVQVDQSSIHFRKAGMYKLHVSGNSELLVYDGQAEVTLAGQTKSVKKGNALSLENVTMARKFDTEKGDALLRWSMRRSGYMAMANVSAASAARSGSAMYSGGMYVGSMYSGRGGMGGWMWNPYYMMYTYLPQRGTLCNGFMGYCYYGPDRVQQAFYTAPSYSRGDNSASADSNSGRSYTYDQNRGYTVVSGDRSYSGLSGGAPASGVGGAPAAASAAAPVAISGGGRAQ